MSKIAIRQIQEEKTTEVFLEEEIAIGYAGYHEISGKKKEIKTK